jgi:tetratricopeptide (TPR) repeat protein
MAALLARLVSNAWSLAVIAIRRTVLAVTLLALFPAAALATGSDAEKAPPVDAAPCNAAIAANDDDKILAACGALIDNERTGKADRLKALIARAGVFVRKDQLDRAIADDGAALRLDATLADLFNSRGELWWKKGDRPKALADFAAALKLNPEHPAAKANYKKLAQELELLGALMAVAGRPSFDCATAHRPAERAICANPELANLDRQISVVSSRLVRAADAGHPGAGRALQREQEDFVAGRDAEFGKPGYDLQQVMSARLEHLLAAARQ